MQDWELVEKLLGLRFFESSVTLVPASALKVEAVDVHTFLWMIDRLALNASIITLDYLLEYVRSVLHFIQSPRLLLSCYLLLHCSQETLRVEESCQPE